MSRRVDEIELKNLPAAAAATALELAQSCRETGEPEEAESICLDLLDLAPEHQEALVLLLLARADLLERGQRGGVERAREVLSRLASDFDREYYAGVLCERQARHLLRTRGRHSSTVAWEWFQYAMNHFETAAGIRPERVEPALRFNACVRLIRRNPSCMPEPDDEEEHGIE